MSSSIRISDILAEIEALAPLPLQEGFDNAGVQAGDISRPATGALLCVDVTEAVVDEAIERGCNLIVAHHPLLFKALKSLTGGTYIERCMIKACKHDLVIYAAHTNLDNASAGVNSRLADIIGLRNARILRPQKHSLMKLVVFVSVAYADAVRNALFAAGAGYIGNYDSCSYNLKGEGTFRPLEDSDPFCGEQGSLHWEKEARIETIIPSFLKNKVIRALRYIHPYEEPAFDIYPLDNDWTTVGSGIVGELAESEDEKAFLLRIKDTFRTGCIKHSPFTGKRLRTVAVCGGSGAFLIPDAIGQGADVFITGEARYNDFYDVEDKILLAVIGHYESEMCTKEIFRETISEKFPSFAVHISNVGSNPVKYL
ncbi:MAG: Nif3-like dinuclear metal center hexameric protein [Bacteroidales bacterium]